MDVIVRPDLWLERLRSSIAAVADADNAEAVHTIRIATRRLDAWLELADIHVLRSDLRRIRHGAGKLRDIDVLRLRDDLPAQVTTWLAEEYASAREEMLCVVHDESVGALLHAFELLPSPSQPETAHRLDRIVRRIFRAGERVERGDGGIDELHRLRRRVKVLRYAREWLGERPQSLICLQTVLGNLNDTAVLIHLLQQHPRPDAATNEFENQCHETLMHQATLASQAWMECEPRLREETEQWIST